MDPNAAWGVLCDRSADVLDRVDAACDLIEWVHSGGFLPDGWDDPVVFLYAVDGIRESL